MWRLLDAVEVFRHFVPHVFDAVEQRSLWVG